MLSVAVTGIILVPLLAALLDAWDRRHGRVQRRSAVVAAERRDLQADMQATQHQGIHSPISDICRDRQRGR